MQDLLVVLLKFFFELQICTSLGKDAPLGKLLDCVLETELVATLKVRDRTLLVEELGEPLYIFEEALVVDGLVVYEFQNVEESHEVAVHDWENV